MKKELILTAVIVACLILAGYAETPEFSIAPSRPKVTYTFPLKEPLKKDAAAKGSIAARKPASLSDAPNGKETALEKTLVLLRTKGKESVKIAEDIEHFLKSRDEENTDGIFRPEWKPFTDLYARVLEDEMRKEDSID